jgi:anthranilate/para-aminobenzoate synthase component I
MPCRPSRSTARRPRSLASLAGEPGAFSLAVPDPVAPSRSSAARPSPSCASTRGRRTRSARSCGSSSVAAARPGAAVPARDGVVGCLAYELGAWTVPGLAPAARDGPLAVLRRYDPVLAFDHRRATWTLIGSSDRDAAWLARCDAPAAAATGRSRRASSARVRPRDVRRGDRAHPRLPARGRRLPGEPHAGVHRAAPGTGVGAATRGSPRGIPPPTRHYVDLGDAQLVCNSPELFLRRRGAHGRDSGRSRARARAARTGGRRGARGPSSSPTRRSAPST